jgi:hypothetical protein
MDGRFLTAFIVPQKWDIIGYNLKPYSLRHTLYLTALDSPFATGKMNGVTPEDILVFLRICSEEHPSLAFRKPTLRDRWRVAWLQSNIDYFFDVIRKIMVYIHDCCSAPMFYTKDEKGEKRKETVPMPLSMATALMCRFGMDEERAWNTPVGQAIWYITTFSIAEGAEIKIMTTEDEQKAEFEKNFLEKLRDEQLAIHKQKMNKKNGGNK